jgi:hypothetical protein
MRFHILASGEDLQVIMRGQITHKLFIRIRLRAPELMIEMYDREHDPELLPEFKQDAQQADGIGSAGDTNANAIARPQQIMLAGVFQN